MKFNFAFLALLSLGITAFTAATARAGEDAPPPVVEHPQCHPHICNDRHVVVDRYCPAPVVETQVIERPIVRTRVVEKPVVVTRVVEKPIYETRVIEKPVVITKVVEKPVVITRVVEKPIVETRVVEKPIYINKVIERPIVETQVVKTCAPPVLEAYTAPVEVDYTTYEDYPVAYGVGCYVRAGWWFDHGGHRLHRCSGHMRYRH